MFGDFKIQLELGKYATIVNMVWVACEQDGHYMVVTDRWQRFSDLVVNEATLAMLSASADEFLVHGVDVEGKRSVSEFPGLEPTNVRLSSMC